MSTTASSPPHDGPGRYRRIRPRLWAEQAFMDLRCNEKLVALYALSGPQTTSVGLCRFSVGQASEDLSIDPAVFKTSLDVVCHALGWYFDPRARVLWIPPWPWENEPASPNVVKSWRKQVDEVPNCALKTAAVTDIVNFLDARGAPFLEAFGEAFPEAFSEGDRKPLLNQEQAQAPGVQYQNKPLRDKRALRANVIPPKFAEFWSAYPRKIGKKKAIKVWHRLEPDAALLEQMLKTLAWQRTQAQWLEDGGQHIPYPEKWLESERWDDEPLEPTTSRGGVE